MMARLEKLIPATDNATRAGRLAQQHRSVQYYQSRKDPKLALRARMRAENLVAICNRLVACHGAPVSVFVDNGSEFSGRLFDLWAYHHKVRIDFSRPGKPTGNCFVETFNESLRD